MLKFIPLIALCLSFTSYAMDNEDPVKKPNGSPLVRCDGFKQCNQSWKNHVSQESTTKEPASPILVKSPKSKDVPKLLPGAVNVCILERLI